jgi:hypothetical protein
LTAIEITDMPGTKLHEEMCESCGPPLFLDKEVCRAFIEESLRRGFIVCSCCGSRNKFS